MGAKNEATGDPRAALCEAASGLGFWGGNAISNMRLVSACFQVTIGTLVRSRMGTLHLFCTCLVFVLRLLKRQFPSPYCFYLRR